ncbi:MAG: cob(I)yrinic acid a,c-diamide adenosyltransferase [Candidatus Omnitrophica bacterium]|nr:cob(I)yrinic acid a,c-diamide adenosyltransferase [Candidatus Omnitrophota bacterium]
MSTQNDNSPRDFTEIKEFTKKGLIIALTGEGKGKSTSAYGTAIRSMGRGYKVGIVQFIKGQWSTGEQKFFASQPLCDMFPMGNGFTWETKNLEQDKQTAHNAWQKCLEILHDQQYKLVIFDELIYVLKYGFLDEQEVIVALKSKPPLKHVIVTGNGLSEELKSVADLVSHVQCVKHPYYEGIKAQPGIEY